MGLLPAGLDWGGLGLTGMGGSSGERRAARAFCPWRVVGAAPWVGDRALVGPGEGDKSAAFLQGFPGVRLLAALSKHHTCLLSN